MNYTAARQLAGLSGTGTIFVLASVAFVYQLPSTFFPFHGGPFYLDWAGFWVLFMAYSLISLPFDIWSGYWLPCHHRQHCELFPIYLGRLFRGLFLQGLVMTISAELLLQAGRRWGIRGATVAFAVLILALLALRSRFAALLGAERPAPLPGRQATVAAVWVLLGFVLSASLPWCGVDTPFALLETLLGCTLWSLLGAGVLRRLNLSAARASLYLSWASFGLLSRATPAFAGLPERWADTVES